ncbi:hypothetical protein SSS_05603 [Sarcoptes scabiei]|uniref:Non-structural maintenance of chromosomes element 4 n=1 Tax=Sarcoptes scabiei TaxID=52283 RepID=A0A131ZZA4_SARSC|nr:hypothetical protein SSS_05603 [Sarcoptes scabiei]KPM04136.1 hypothetical protein QR98_0025760 [Sarcoptes scabiei]UXI15480.1 Transmembrane protein [Sarcoptes scabiei]
MEEENEVFDSNKFLCSIDENEWKKTQNKIIGHLNINHLNEKTRREAILEYNRIYQETKSIDKEELELKEMLMRLNTSVNKENSCLSKFGINELLMLDAKNISLTSELGHELAKKVEVTEKFDAKHFRRKLRIALINNMIRSNLGEIDPSKRLQLIHLYPTGRKYRNLFYSPPSISKHFRYDSIQNEPTTKSQRAVSQRKKFPTGQSTQPTQYDSKNLNNIDESQKRLEHIYRSLRKLESKNDGTVPFLQASLNPDNFATTVENIFNIAFLVRQSKIVIDLDENDCEEASIEDLEPIIQTKEPEQDNNEGINVSNDQNSTSKSKKSDIQSIFSFDMETYQKLIDKFEINRTAIK